MLDLFDDHEKLTKDLPNQRIVQFEENSYLLKRTDPYGFWNIQNVKGGVVPRGLRGQYTSAEEANKAILIYFNKKKNKE